jgi:DNA (cytosine-5)-methyltransferase 1
MNVLDLFSGIGGFSLGLERAGMKTVAFCEIEPFPRKVLQKHWPGVPIFNDVRTLRAKDIKETVDVVCGGYPCQPFSTAGKRRGKEDDRHLWPEYLRIIQDVCPRWIIAENVAGHINMGLDQVLSDLENESYTWWTFIIPACGLDAPHKRDRIWIVANSKNKRLQRVGVTGESGGESGGEHKGCGPARRSDKANDVANANEVGRRRIHKQPRILQTACEGSSSASCEGWINRGKNTIGEAWEVEPGVGRVADGISSRVDRIKGLGNAVIPQIPEIIGRAIIEIES